MKPAAGDIRLRGAGIYVAVAAVLICAAILWAARSYTFYFDEWTFIIGSPDWSLASYFQPHNEHPSIALQALYAVLLHTAGLRTYLPYMAILLAIHAANVVLLYGLVRRRCGQLVGVGAAALLLVLGAGWDDILWAFQIGWLASVGFGLAMLITLIGGSSPRRAAIAAALLTGSLLFSGVGVPFAAAAVVLLAFTAGRRRELAWFVPVGLALAAWYVAFGRFGQHPDPQPTAANLFLMPGYTLWGMAQSAAAVIGEAGWIAVPLLAVAIAAVAWAWWRRRDPFPVAVAAGLVSFFAVAGLTRAQLGYAQAASSRYMYVGALLWIVLLAEPARSLPWRGTWRPAIAACVFLACFNSAALLLSFATARTVLMERQVADLYALAAERSDPCLNPNGAVDLYVMPVETSPSLYYRAVDLYGDPRDGMTLIDTASFEAGVARLRRPGC
ncbi:MAG TPA: hypothetical protein VJT78_03875 [Candidatus Dormibacteraeota bacterium]|nr:hypothetical protein [Candidatus Dormibacteraeota bacterium]